VIERVMQTYAEARLYTDRGTVTSALGGEEQTIEFETAFERPDRFSFAFRFHSTGASAVGHRAYLHEHRIDVQGTVVRLGDPAWRSSPPASLGLAVATLTGISFGCAHRIPRLLIPERIGGRALFEWPERVLRDPVEIDGDRHLVVEVGSAERRARVAINEETYVVRRSVDSLGPVFTTDYFAILTPGR
jgi:hypothetical protein